MYDSWVSLKAGLGGDYLCAQFAHGEVIAILTFVACAQLLTWPGPPPEAADSETTVSGSSVLGFSEAR